MNFLQLSLAGARQPPAQFTKVSNACNQFADWIGDRPQFAK
jgi:hypothetical protein